MVAPAVKGIDLFNIAGCSISGWVPSLKTGMVVRQPFCSQFEERLKLWLEDHPLAARTYRLPTPKHAPCAIGCTFEGQSHNYLPDIVGRLQAGKLFIAEAGMEKPNAAWHSFMGMTTAIAPPNASELSRRHRV